MFLDLKNDFRHGAAIRPLRMVLPAKNRKGRKYDASSGRQLRGSSGLHAGDERIFIRIVVFLTDWHRLFCFAGMNTLFPLEPSLPSGFSYYPDFITEAEEKELMKAIEKIRLHTFQFRGYAAKRKVASFGYDWSFEKQRLSKGKEIPEEFEGLIRKVTRHIAIPSEEVAELLVTEYPVGSAINWHRDAPPFRLIAGVSLRGACIFRLRPYDKVKQGRHTLISFPVQRRSLYLIEGEARTGWQHSTTPVTTTRYSITLRTLKEGRDKV